jgi:hypothetical protein
MKACDLVESLLVFRSPLCAIKKTSYKILRYYSGTRTMRLKFNAPVPRGCGDGLPMGAHVWLDIKPEACGSADTPTTPTVDQRAQLANGEIRGSLFPGHKC